LEAGKSLAPASFDLGDNIYCRYYLKKNLSDLIYYSSDSYITIKFKKGEKELLTVEVNMGGQRAQKSSELFLNEVLTPKQMDNLNNLDVGTHDIAMEILVNDHAEKPQKLIATGTFKLTKKAGNKMGKGKLGVTFSSLVVAKMTNPSLEKEALKALESDLNLKYFDGFDKKVKVVPLKLKIVSEDWGINNNLKTGAVIGRYIDVAILVNEDGNCLIKVVRMEQKYNGSGYQESFGGYIGDAIIDDRAYQKVYHPLHKTPVDCE
jgi:hypothetical protein